MKIKKEKWKPAMEILFTYLAISKIIYWYNNVTAMGQGDILGAIQGFMIRFVYNDLVIIIGVVFFYFLYKLLVFKKSRERTVLKSIIEGIIFYAVGFVVIAVVSIVYSVMLAGIEGVLSEFNWSEFNWNGLWVSAGNAVPAYIVVCVVLVIKEYSKKKGKEIAECETDAQINDKKISMLESLLKDGVLTQEEFDDKKEKVLGISIISAPTNKTDSD
ncbi:MAG: SHOCT domain-containing protein [Defluviitaleaceae bacterium]|nr:SHOCT domain-containing protein [Defluviitaleaceae bacterium]